MTEARKQAVLRIKQAKAKQEEAKKRQVEEQDEQRERQRAERVIRRIQDSAGIPKLPDYIKKKSNLRLFRSHLLLPPTLSQILPLFGCPGWPRVYCCP